MEKTEDVSLCGMHVLVAEDNKINAQIVKHILSGFDAVVTQAENGRVCIDKLTGAAPGTYQVILMDIRMPEMDGLEAARQIRALEQGNDIPIYAMTADIMPETVDAFTAAGMNGYLAKPINVSELITVLAKHI